MTMTQRFHRGRWSETRKQIDAMAKGDVLTFGADQYFNAKASVERLNDAYIGDRKWKIATQQKEMVITHATVTRTK